MTKTIAACRVAKPISATLIAVMLSTLIAAKLSLGMNKTAVGAETAAPAPEFFLKKRNDPFQLDKVIRPFSETVPLPQEPLPQDPLLQEPLLQEPLFQQPLLEDLLEKKGTPKGRQVFIRIFKQESQLELWMKREDRFTLVKTYEICAWSGKLGPKLKEGDLQSPEGFYYVSKKSLNPNSQFHLSFNLGYPNSYDRAHQRTGTHLMVHGACVSIGCYAMTDKYISEIYELVEAALNAGNRFVRVHIFPFRMTAENIDKARGKEWIDFWWNLKQGYDLFEARLLPPNVRVCGKAYIFDPPPLNAQGIPNWTRDCR